MIDSTPEFTSYKRTHAARWGEITMAIQALERLLTTYDVPLAYVDGKRLARLAADPFNKWTCESLLECVVNRDRVLECVKTTGRLFAVNNDKDAAATYIQKNWRLHQRLRIFAKMRRDRDSATLIARTYHRYRQTKLFKQRISQQLNDTLVLPSYYVL